jgi:protein-L-isoaspartate(D-aspartate) O-methyltransferase
MSAGGRTGKEGREQGAVLESSRRAMVEKLQEMGVQDAAVLRAMGSVPRHRFVEGALHPQAYADISLPIGAQQTISRPYTVARMIAALRAGREGKKLGKVLEVGTGCGYQAAVLSQVSVEVYSVERIQSLHELARTNLRALRIANLRLQYGDGTQGLPDVAPFDAIIIAAAGLAVPKSLLLQLETGGRLVAPVGSTQQMLQLTERLGADEWRTVTLENCHFVPLRQGVA